MSASAERKEAGGVATEDGPWVTLNKATVILGEHRESVQKRALLGQIQTTGVAHVVLYLERDVRRIAQEKQAAAAAASPTD